MNLLEEYRELESDGQVRVNHRESHGLYNISYLHGGVGFNNPLTLVHLNEFHGIDTGARLVQPYIHDTYIFLREEDKLAKMNKI